MIDLFRLEYIVFLTAFAATYLGVGSFRAWSIRKGYLDHPNERSSHENPTPRGGGLVIALVTLSAYVAGSWIIGYELSIGFLIGAVLIVGVSWLDDVYSLSFIWRLLVHLAAAGAMIASTGYFDSITIPLIESPLYVGKFGIPIAVIWIAWFVNAYNFMDGIDGIAGIQAFAAGIGWMILGYFLIAPPATLIGGVIAFSSIGFLIHNWQPAKIFMGDAGSAFLGFTFASMPFLIREQANVYGSALPYVAVLFVWLFVFDSALTLLRRLIRGERVWTPHREHLYQRLVIAGRSHRSVSLAYGIAAIVIVLITSLTFDSNMPSRQFVLFLAVLVPTFLLVLAARSYE